MNIQNINNTNINNINNSNLYDTNNINSLNSKSQSSAIEIGTNPLANSRTDLSNSISKQIDQLSTLATLGSQITNQIHTLDKIQNNVSELSNGSKNELSLQPEIAKTISNYNITNEHINNKIKQSNIIDNVSHSYFDGKAGSIPLNLANLESIISNNKSELTTTLDQISQLNNSFKQNVDKLIQAETVKSQEQSPFKSINFGKESSDFTSTKINNLAGSIASSQSNATQITTIKLLS